MKAKALHKVQFRGDVFRPGAVIEVTEAEAKTDFVKAHFALQDKEPADAVCGFGTAGSPAPLKEEEKVVAGLTREQAIEALKGRGVKIRTTMKDETIRSIYEETFSAEV